jgi:hypothetical protein
MIFALLQARAGWSAVVPRPSIAQAAVPEREVLVHRQDWSLDRSLDWSLD